MRSLVEYSQRIVELSNSTRRQDYDEKDMTKTQMDFLDLAGRVNMDDFALQNILEVLRKSRVNRSIELADDIITDRRHRAVENGIIWILEGR